MSDYSAGPCSNRTPRLQTYVYEEPVSEGELMYPRLEGLLKSEASNHTPPPGNTTKGTSK